jgi:molybdopterin biosynthesis enzyme MoaB
MLIGKFDLHHRRISIKSLLVLSSEVMEEEEVGEVVEEEMPQKLHEVVAVAVVEEAEEEAMVEEGEAYHT